MNCGKKSSLDFGTDLVMLMRVMKMSREGVMSFARS